MTSVFVVSEPDYDNKNIDSIWSTEPGALARAREIGSPYLVEYSLDRPDGFVRSGWFNPDGPNVWSDWGYPEDRPAKYDDVQALKSRGHPLLWWQWTRLRVLHALAESYRQWEQA